MAYSSVTSVDADPPAHTSNKLTAANSPSPHLPEFPITPLSLAFDEITGHVLVDDPTVRPTTRDSKVGKFLASMTGSNTSYDLVEDDDYEEVPTNRSTSPVTVATLRQTAEDLPVRTASVSRQLPLNHPVPDLQSLQGAYVKNVERLEESAERLSMTSSLEGELQKLKMDQRRRERTASASSRDSQRSKARHLSGHSLSNSIIDVNAYARSGGYSPAGYITSPVGSIRSPRISHAPVPNRQPSKTAKFGPPLSEPEFEGRPLESMIDFQPHYVPHIHDPRPARSPSNASHKERPGSAASGDTFQQAHTLFNDFDGVHYHADRMPPGRRVPLAHPPRARDSKAFREPQPGTEMIYYPAPVPVMLNLPVRLSKMNWGDREKKRLQALSGMPEDMRKSAPWLANEDVVDRSNRQSMGKLPSQLRASAFFDHKGTEQNVQLKDGSAVATLDSILDAAAHAPVSAFTDHPIAGNLGKDFYGPDPAARKPGQKSDTKKQKTKRKTATSMLLKSASSNDNLSMALGRQSQLPSAEASKIDLGRGDARDDDGAASISPSSDELSEGESEGSESDAGQGSEDESHHPGFSTAPTTLLAELQMRKAQQKKRNRTAADAFPNGMHSTLLELDTVTQLQQKARKQKHITLAWEDREAADKENFDDEDVPLGVLFPEQERKDHVNVHRPLGLMEKRQLEENEPLSMRRARLRGEPLAPPMAPRSTVGSHYADDAPVPTIELPKLEDPESDDDPEETMAQRIKRMKERREKGTSAQFARDLSGELGLKQDPEPASASTPAASKTPDVEETLGQRRKRLQQEALQNGGVRQSSNGYAEAGPRPVLRPSHSLADVLQRNPIGFVHPNESKTSSSAMQSFQQGLTKNTAYLADQQAAAMRPGFGSNHVSMTNTYTQQQARQNMPYLNAGAPYMSTYSMPMQMQMPMQMPAAMNNQMSMGMGMGMNMNMGMGAGMGMNPVYPGMSMGYPPNSSSNAAAAAAMAMGIGPPLDAKQRATIDQWRQGIA